MPSTRRCAQARPEVVFHLAGLIGAQSAERMWEVNVGGFTVLCDALRRLAPANGRDRSGCCSIGSAAEIGAGRAVAIAGHRGNPLPTDRRLRPQQAGSDAPGVGRACRGTAGDHGGAGLQPGGTGPRHGTGAGKFRSANCRRLFTAGPGASVAADWTHGAITSTSATRSKRTWDWSSADAAVRSITSARADRTR